VSYDIREAQHIVAKELSSNAGAEERRNAALVLLREAGRIKGAGTTEIEYVESEERLSVRYSIGNHVYRDALLYSAEKGGWCWSDGHPDRVQPIALPLWFNPVSGVWESDELDRFIVPEPGKAYPRRSGVAVVWEAIVAKLRK